MPEDEVTPSLAPAQAASLSLLSPLHLPTKGARPSGMPDAFELDGPLSPTGKAAASALFVLSGSRAGDVRRAPAASAGSARRPPLTEDEEEVRAAAAWACAWRPSDSRRMRPPRGRVDVRTRKAAGARAQASV